MNLKINVVSAIVLSYSLVATASHAAEWNLFDGSVYDSGLWRVDGNWNPATFPDAAGAVASFPDMTTTTSPGVEVQVDVDADVTFGEIFLGITRGGSRWRLVGTGKLIPDSGNTVDRALIHGGRITAGGLSAIVDNDIEIPASRLLQLNSRSSDSTTTYNGAITGAAAQNIDLLLSSDGSNGNLIFTNDGNDFGTGAITMENGVRVQFQNIADVANPNVSGGASTTVTVVDSGSLVYFSTSADADFGTNVVFQADGGLNPTRLSPATQNDVTIGDLTLDPGVTVNLGHTWGHSLVIGAGDVMTLGVGAAITQSNAAGGHSGDLKIDGTLQGSGSIALTSGTTGTQASDLVIRSGGTLAPGQSTGILNLEFNDGGSSNPGSLVFQAGSTLAMDIEGVIAGSGYDQIITDGASMIDISGATLDLTDNSPTLGTGTISLWLIVSNDPSTTVTGTFAGLAEGAVATEIDGRMLQIFYGADFASGSLTGGNDILLFSQGVPEPSTLVLLALGCLVLRCTRRRAVK